MRRSPYKLSIELNVLDHLGVNLYSNVPAVLSEIVANSWDADATRVDVKLDSEARTIVIEDNGEGMDERQANERYLKVGYRRREEGRAVTPSGRRVHGRKGIGKLAPFAVAEQLEVRSKQKTGDGACAFRMIAEHIRDAAERCEDYYPDPVDATGWRKKYGTQITLRQLKRSISELTVGALKQRIARRFSIIGQRHKFRVYVDASEITPADRGYDQHVQFIWIVGEKGDPGTFGGLKTVKRDNLPGLVDAELAYSVKGWIGTVDERKNIDESTNTIVVMARGKLVHEDILAQLGEGGVFAKYIVGELYGEFLDQDDKDDIATSDRQNVKEDDPRFEKLRKFVKNDLIRPIEKRWTTWRNEIAETVARQNPVIDEWFEQLTPDRRKHARSLFRKIETLRLPDEESRREVYRHGVLAFEALVLRDKLSVLGNVESEADFDLLKGVFADIDEIEAVEYYNIVKARVEVLRKFERIVPKSRERVIQEHIFDHLWLLHSSWERASTNQRMEQTVNREFKKIKLTEEEKRGRLDIRYKTAAGKHIIIELKRYKVRVDVTDLVKQIRKYRSALQKCLKLFPDEPNLIEIICILGSPPLPRDQEKENVNTLKAYDARYVTYDSLIAETQKSYADFLVAEQRIKRIVDVVARL